MSSSRANIIAALYRSDQKVFRLKEIALLTGISDFNSLNKRIFNLVKKGELLNLRKGIYALHDFTKPELASKIFNPSYLSLDYVLQKSGLIFQYNSSYTSVSYLSRTIEMDGFSYTYRKIKNEILMNTSGIEVYRNGISEASPERAFLDYLYLNGDTYIDNPAILDRQKVKRLLPIFNTKTLTKRVLKILENA